MKKSFFILVLIHLSIYFAFFYKKQNVKINLSVFVKVDASDEKLVFSERKVFNLDKEKGSYKLCVGETSIKTEDSFCKIKNKNEVVVTHIINNSVNRKSFFMCIYLDESLTTCSIAQ